MLHDGIMSRSLRPPGARQGDSRADDPSLLERRDSDRVPFPAELVLVWNHDLHTPMRYRVIDAGDGGYRIRTSTPLIEGMTGMVIRMLPSQKGVRLDQPVMVVWTHPVRQAPGRDSKGDSGRDSSGDYEAGLRCF
jgi:hypothetical protein